jgi:hypothetical protein
MKLYIKELLGKNKPRSLTKFLDIFFVGEYLTGYKNADGSNRIVLLPSCTKATYMHEKCANINKNCYNLKMRSFDDLLALAKTYYPNITAKRLFHILITKSYRTKSALPGHPDTLRYCQLHNCSGMRRIRFTYSNSAPTMYSTACILSKYDSKFCWEELFHMLNISSQEQLDAYIKKYTKLVDLTDEKRCKDIIKYIKPVQVT